MYECLDCGHIFDEPKQYSEDMTPSGAFEGESFIGHYNGCPLCSGEYEDYSDDVFHYHTYEKDLYKEAIQDLEKLKGE